MSYPLASIIQEIAERAGMDPEQLDLSLIDPDIEVEGFMTSAAHSAAGALQALSQVYFFDPSSHGGVVHFVPRGGDPVATIDADELLESGEDANEERRGDAIGIPRVLHLNYHDVEGLLATSKQQNERAGDRRAKGEVSIQSPVVMTSDYAAQVVSINHKLLIEDQRGELTFALPDSYIRLAVADVIELQGETKTERLRITAVEIFEGYQQIRAVRDRQSVYSSDASGIAPATPTAPVSRVVTPTLLAVLQIPPLQDADDVLGYYVAVAGAELAWTGTLVEISYDGGANYGSPAALDIPAVFGELTTTLADHPQSFPDEVNVFEVELLTPGAELEATDLEGLLSRQNLAIVGDELIQFAGANETSNGTWEISYLLRGRRGTMPTSHSIGERFVLLNRETLALFGANVSDVGRTLTLRATSFGLTTDDATVQAITFNGGTQRELAPGYVSARRSGTDLVIDWQGVGRLGSGATAVHGARFAGYRVTVTDGSNTVVTDTAAQTLTQGVSGWSSPITVRVAQRNDLAGVGPHTEVSIA